MTWKELTPPPFLRFSFFFFFSPGPADFGEVAGARFFWSGGRSGWYPCSPKSSGSSRFPANILTQPRFLAMSVCCQSDTRKWTRLACKRRGSPACFSSTGAECFVILTCLVRGITSLGCASPHPPLSLSLSPAVRVVAR